MICVAAGGSIESSTSSVARAIAAVAAPLGLEEAGSQFLSQVDPSAVRMARIGVTPSWVSLIDFQTRLPSPLGGIGS